MNKFLFLSLTLMSLSFGVSAKPKSNPKVFKSWVKLDIQPFDEKTASLPFSKGRKVANYSGDPASYDDLVKSFNALKTSAELESFISLNKQRLNSFSDPSSVFFLSHVTALQPLRGIVWRSRGLFESNGGKNRLSQSAIVTQLKSYAGFLSIVNPSETQAAVFDYLVAPYSLDGSLPEKIENESQLQAWMQESLKPAVITLKNKLNTIPAGSEIKWNQQINFGAKSFSDGVERDLVFGTEEVQVLVASYELNAAEINMFCAYNQTGTMDFAQDVGKLYGFDGFIFNNVDGVTSNDVASVIRASRYAKLWTLNPDFGQEAMREAGTLITSAVYRSENAWNHFSKRDEEGDFALSSLIAQVGKKGALATFLNTKRALKGERIRSAITGEIVKFNAPKFFNESPIDLKAFYPTYFVKNKTKEVVLSLNGQNKKIAYRDYTNGSAVGWNVSEYQKYFEVAGNEDIKRSLRVMNHSLSGFLSK